METSSRSNEATVHISRRRADKRQRFRSAIGVDFRSRRFATFARTASVLCVAAFSAVAVTMGSADSHADPGGIADSDKYEPRSYDTSPTAPGQMVRAATPADTALDRLSGEGVLSWWMLKEPDNPRHSLLVIELEPGWSQPRHQGQGGNFVWTVVDEANSVEPQFPFLNGTMSLQNGTPGMTPDYAVADGRPGIRSKSYSIDYLPESDTWHVHGRAADQGVDFTADHPVAGSYYKIPVNGPGTEPTNVDAVSNSHITGSVTFGGRTVDVTGWRGEYWRMDMFPSLVGSQLAPSTAWRGWEWNNVMEPDGGGSQFYGILNRDGQYSGALVDARPSGFRACSKTVLEFGDYRYGRSAFGDITPPFKRYTVPGWIKVRCAPGESVQMEKIFYPDSTDYADVGLLDFTEMPIHTVPGSFGNYEHERYSNYR